LETGFQYCPSPQFGGNGTSGGLHTLPTGSHHSPFRQSSGCAEPAAGVTSDRAAIGARAAVRIVERRMSFRMTSACPIPGTLKPLGWTRRIPAWMQVDLAGAAETTTHRRQSPERAPGADLQRPANSTYWSSAPRLKAVALLRNPHRSDQACHRQLAERRARAARCRDRGRPASDRIRYR
jgi:hypothetical protein